MQDLLVFPSRKGSRVYPSPDELLEFGRRVCGVANPRAVIDRIAQGMARALSRCSDDPRIASQLHAQVSLAWEPGFVLAKEIAGRTPP
jgi:serine/threonine-protein kinase HipA